jgi:hypothetical protein
LPLTLVLVCKPPGFSKSGGFRAARRILPPAQMKEGRVVKNALAR